MNTEIVIKELKEVLLGLLEKKYSELKPEIREDIDDFLDKSKEKLERWSLLLLENAITAKEFEWLLKSQKDIILLKALYSAGVSKIRLNTIKNSIIKTTFDVVLTSIIK